MSGLSLYTIEQALLDLMEAREEVLESLALPTEVNVPLPEPLATEYRLEHEAELAEIDKALAEYATKEVAKIDSVHAWLKQATLTASAARQEAAEMAVRAQRLEAGIKRLNAICVDVMAARGLKRLEGTGGRALVRRGNGGVAPLHVDSLDILPLCYQMVTVRMSRDCWDAIKELDELLGEKLVAEVKDAEPNNSRIRAALLDGQNIPGARLLERGEHLELR
jgi:hypothetical protein